MENVRELWTKEKSMGISVGEVGGDVERGDADEARAMTAMIAMIATIATIAMMENGGLAHGIKDMGATGGEGCGRIGGSGARLVARLSGPTVHTSASQYCKEVNTAWREDGSNWPRE